MKKFLFKLFLFLITFFLFIYIFFSKLEDQLAQDNFYFKFTTPKQSSMILGTSRALQGLIPEIINKELNIDIYNYAFTVMNSSYGPSYLNSIKKKLNKNSKDGVFILAVDPWSISTKFNPSDDLNYAVSASFFSLYIKSWRFSHIS